ncbi:MAG TPA: hypothetical protein VGJ22_01165 [Anaerolineales bacterium]|jgi:hypothetical protein
MFISQARTRTAVLCLILAVALACNMPGTAEATQTQVPGLTFLPATEVATQTDTPPAPSASPEAAVLKFKVAVIVDTLSEPVTRAQAQSLVDDADRIFESLTGFGIELVDYVEDGAGGTTSDMATRYIQSYASVFPNGVIIFSYGDNGDAKLYGGYSYSLPGVAGFHNTFVSPATGDGQVYVAVVHFSHKYAACGYNGLDVLQSAVSVYGECRNQPGTACVQHNGYSMCENAVADLYASTPTYFAATTIIHEILHAFSPGGNDDHYATPQCNATMGWAPEYFVFEESQLYNGLYPFVYQNFIYSYQP